MCLLGIFTTFGNNSLLTNNFFIKGTFEKEGVSFVYSGVVKFNTSTSSNYTSDLDFNFYLASFYIEEITYKGLKYRNHELFGYTFPKEMLSRINIDGIVNYKNATTTLTVDLSSFDKTKFSLSPAQISILKKETANPEVDFERGLEIRLKLVETNNIEFPINTTLISNIKKAIKNNKVQKTEEEREKEYLRLLTEGNILLNENNYKESLKSYSIAKNYTADIKNITAKINTVEGFITRNRTQRTRPVRPTIERINPITDFKSAKDQKKYSELEAKVNSFLTKNEYAKAIESLNEAKKYTTNIKSIDARLATIQKFAPKTESIATKIKGEKVKRKKLKKKRNSEIVSDSESSSFNRTKTIIANKVDRKLSYGELLKKGSQSLGNKQYIKSKVYFEAAREKAINKETVDKILVSVNRLIENQSESIPSKEVFNDDSVLASNSDLPKEQKSSKAINSDLAEKAEILKAQFGEGDYRKGFIKYKRDEQAVVDAFDKIIIPYGKYEILRYRAGFANIKMKDDVALKTIECIGKNDEYSWSARIFQNPWIETVVDEKGAFVDELTKRVEIYVVDNVSLLPYDEVPQRIRDSYKDPNIHAGTEFVSAFHLWEHENAKRPDIIARRKQIQDFKDASKAEAYAGADKCKEEVAISIEEVYAYYKQLGYEIIVKY